MSEERCLHCVFCGKCKGERPCDNYFPVTEEGMEEYEIHIQNETHLEYANAWNSYISEN